MTVDISGTAIIAVVRGASFPVKIKIYLLIKDNVPHEEYVS